MKRHPLRHPSAPVVAALFLLMGVLTGCAWLFREARNTFLNVNAEFASKKIEIVINKSFIERYKDRVSITTTFTVDKAVQNASADIFDGDFHMSGRAPEIGLPAVAEIANGASAKKATDLVHGAMGTGKTLKISGVWRIWPEHGGGDKQEQGTPLDAMDSTNPSHVFEIHPVTRINNVAILDTFRAVEGYKAQGASNTFGIFEKVECTLTIKPESVSMVTRKGVYNDVEFIMEIADGRQIQAPGGRFVIASARDLKGNMLVERLRMVFAEDTPPERAVRLLKRGGRLHVFGLPRVNFAEISRRVKGSRTDPTLLVKPLPYEIIIQGIYKDSK